MVSEEKIKALVGHEFPGGEYLIEHWENFLLTLSVGANPESVGRKMMKNNVVHPTALYHVPIYACNTSIEELYELGHADSEASTRVESFEYDMLHPLIEDVSYKGNGKITEAERCKDNEGNTYDRIQFAFELTNPEGELTARTIITLNYLRS